MPAAWVAAAGAVASVASGVNSADASKSAANAQIQSSQDAIGEQQREFNITQQNNAPFLTTGTAANTRLSQLLGLDTPAQNAKTWALNTYLPMIRQAQAANGTPLDPNWQPDDATLTQWAQFAPASATAPAPDSGSLLKPFSQSDLAADPVYNAGLNWGADQGSKAIAAQALANGNYDSGATLKALTQFGNDYGTTKAQQAYNDYLTNNQNTFNMLSGASGTGQVASNTIANAGSNTANSISNLVTGQGNATAAGIVGQANAVNSAASGVNSAVNNYNNSQLLSKLINNNGGSSGSSSYEFPSSFLPEGKHGGFVIGPSHDGGGVNAELEGGEVVIPKDVVRKKGSKFFHKLIAEHHAAY